jgi:hypothetical protein
MKIEIDIEEIVLYGFPVTDRLAIGEAVSAELAKLIAEQGAPASFKNNLNLSSLRSSDVVLTSSMLPASLGAQIAQSIYQSLDHVDVIR